MDRVQRATGSYADRAVTSAVEADAVFCPLEEPTDHETAAAVYRTCRRAGTTIRRLPDCLIAVVAIRSGATLLHRDADFDAIARHTPLAVTT